MELVRWCRLVIVLLTGCGLSAGPFHGTLGQPGVSAGPGASHYGTSSVGVSNPSSGNAKVGGFICDRCGYGLGLMPGYGHISILRNGRTLEQTERNLRLYMQWVYHLWNNHSLSLEEAFEIDTLKEPDAVTGVLGDVGYLGYGSALKYIHHPNDMFQWWVGGGLLVGGVGGTSALGPRAVAGIQTRFGRLGPFVVLLRAEGSVARGQNEFKQEWVNAGFSFWMDPDYRF